MPISIMESARHYIALNLSSFPFPLSSLFLIHLHTCPASTFLLTFHMKYPRNAKDTGKERKQDQTISFQLGPNKTFKTNSKHSSTQNSHKGVVGEKEFPLWYVTCNHEIRNFYSVVEMRYGYEDIKILCLIWWWEEWKRQTQW